MRYGTVTLFVITLLIFSACSPVTGVDNRINDRRPFNIDLDKTNRSTLLSSANSPSIELNANDATSLKMLVGYSTQVTGLCNAYLASMDDFFRSFRSYYQSMHRFREDASALVQFEQRSLIPKLSEQQQQLETQFQAVDFLSEEQNQYVIRSLQTLQKRLRDLDGLSGTLNDYVQGKSYQDDVELKAGEELMMTMNDHCAQFYQTHQELTNFLDDLQFSSRQQMLASEVDGEASINVLSDMRNLKGLIQRLGDFRVETDDLHDLSASYKSVVLELKEHTAYPVEKISDSKTRDDYKVIYNSIYAQMLPRINKVIYELENQNKDWLDTDFNSTMEGIFKSYNDLSRFYAEGYGKPAPLPTN